MSYVHAPSGVGSFEHNGYISTSSAHLGPPHSSMAVLITVIFFVIGVCSGYSHFPNTVYYTTTSFVQVEIVSGSNECPALCDSTLGCNVINYEKAVVSSMFFFKI